MSLIKYNVNYYAVFSIVYAYIVILIYQLCYNRITIFRLRPMVNVCPEQIAIFRHPLYISHTQLGPLACVVTYIRISYDMFLCRNLAFIQLVQQQRDRIFAVPKPAVHNLSTCLELLKGSLDTISGWWHCRKWGRAENSTLLYTYPICREPTGIYITFINISTTHF